MGLDSFLADDCGRDPGGDFPAREVSKGTAFVFNSARRLALLDSICRAQLGSAIDRLCYLPTSHVEALLKSAFRKLAHVRSLTGGTNWYLSQDCLLAAKRVMYAVEYRRFYLRDLESVVVWPRRLWLLRPIIPGVLLGALSSSLWHWANSTAGAIFGGMALMWVVLELALGPTAGARIRTTGGTVELPLVSRTRRARKVLEKIDEAVRATRAAEQLPAPAGIAQQPERPLQTTSEASATATFSAAMTNGS